MLRKLIVLAILGLVGGFVGPTEASAGGFTYQKRFWVNNDVINGQIRGECGYQCVTSWYRAGSGNGGTNPCAYGHWLPNGTYNVLSHTENKNDLIKGRTWYMNDVWCGGNLRTELFVHTEETSAQGQTCGSPYDERYCWDGASDYYSLGCIKVRRLPLVNGVSHIGLLDSFHHNTSTVTTVFVTD